MQFRMSTRSRSCHGAGRPKIQSCKRKAKAQEEEVAGAAECRPDALARGQAFALGAVHEEGQGDAGQEQEDGRGHAAEELRKSVRAAGAQLGFQEGIEDVALQHDDGAEAAQPIEILQSVRLVLVFITCRGRDDSAPRLWVSEVLRRIPEHS